MTFPEVVAFAATNPEFVDNIDRLTGNRFGEAFRAIGMNHMIDKASGRFHSELTRFSAYVFDLIWIRLPVEA